MSAAPDRPTVLPQVRPDPPVGRPRLALVPPPARAPRAPFVVLILVLLGLGLLALLLLNTVLAQDAFVLANLQHRNQLAHDAEQELREATDRLANPASLARRAGDLGMVPATTPPLFVTPNGSVLGAVPKGAKRPSAGGITGDLAITGPSGASPSVVPSPPVAVPPPRAATPATMPARTPASAAPRPTATPAPRPTATPAPRATQGTPGAATTAAPHSPTGGHR